MAASSLSRRFAHRWSSRGNLRRDAAFVASTELARWADHPAFLIRTQLVLPGIDVRTLSNSLRQMFTDAQTQQIIPVGNSDGLILTGHMFCHPRGRYAARQVGIHDDRMLPGLDGLEISNDSTSKKITTSASNARAASAGSVHLLASFVLKGSLSVGGRCVT